MSIFVDTSAFYAAVDSSDLSNKRTKGILESEGRLVTTDHILLESWFLISSRLGRVAADGFWDALRKGAAVIENTTAADLNGAWDIARQFSDQDFSIVDLTSFAVMRRLGLTRVASLDNDFSIFRYGKSMDRAFEILR